MPARRSIGPQRASLQVTWGRGARSFEGHVSTERLRRAFAEVRRAHDSAPRRVSLVLVLDAQMAELHAAYLGIRGPTDVLSFDLRRGDPRGPIPDPEVEIVVDLDVACREARRRKLPFQRELELYLSHGLLHTCGFDDRSPKERRRMRGEEMKILKTLGWGTGRRALHPI